MPIYAIGDVQGCYEPLQRLLEKIHFNPEKDCLWFTGDLVNRGPDSLKVLRFIKSLGNKHVVVLGNHDLHLLAVAYGVAPLRQGDTLDEVLSAPDRHELIDWLRHRPLLFHQENYVLTHAGLLPSWSLQQAIHCAKEVEQVLQSENPEEFLKNMYGNQPDCWNDNLTGIERLRFITNCFTRMRFCYPDGRLDLSNKGMPDKITQELLPWFKLQRRANRDLKILFGHWAALGGKADVANIYPLDTGCVWGHCLTAMCLEDERPLCVTC